MIFDLKAYEALVPDRIRYSLPFDPPQGLHPVDPCPPRHREGLWLDQAVRRAAAVQAARLGQRKRRVRPPRDRLQPDPSGQPAQTGHGDGMNSGSQRCGHIGPIRPSNRLRYGENGLSDRLNNSDQAMEAANCMAMRETPLSIGFFRKLLGFLG
jgi:hypothetical protein